MKELQELVRKFRQAKKGTVNELIEFCSDQQVVIDALRIEELRRQNQLRKKAKDTFNVDNN